VADLLIEKKHPDLARTVARRIAQDSPHLADLEEEELAKLARVVIVEGLQDELKAAVKLEKIPYSAKSKCFSERASRSGSPHTLKAYKAGLPAAAPRPGALRDSRPSSVRCIRERAGDCSASARGARFADAGRSLSSRRRYEPYGFPRTR
jgi:hypothetical protein